MSRVITLMAAKKILQNIVREHPDNKVDMCRYVGAGGDTGRCIAGEFAHVFGVTDDELSTWDKYTQNKFHDLVNRNKLGDNIRLTPVAAAYLDAAQAYQDGDADAKRIADGTDLEFQGYDKRPWSDAYQFAERFWNEFFEKHIGYNELALTNSVVDVTKAEDVTDKVVDNE